MVLSNPKSFKTIFFLTISVNKMELNSLQPKTITKFSIRRKWFEAVKFLIKKKIGFKHIL